MNQKPTKGFLVVASKKKSFYYAAINLLEGIKDYYPDAKTCLVTDEEFHDRETDIDHIIFTEVKNDYRAKLWGMAKSPFDITMYLDADMEVVHEDIATVFDQLGDNDMVFTKLCDERDKAFKSRHFPKGSFQLNGGVCLYRSSNQKVLDFMYRWWDLYTQQLANQWWPLKENSNEWDEVGYGNRKDQKYWDQFTLWYLTHEEDKWSDLKIDIFEDDLRWNYYTGFMQFNIRPEGEPIVLHYSSGFEKDNDIFKHS